MIIKENLIIKNKPFVKQYSDLNVMIQKVNTKEFYAEAIDPEEFERKYIETNIPIEEEEVEYEEN